MVILLIIVLALVLFFVFLQKRLGGNSSKEERSKFSQLENYENGKFVNAEPTKMNMNFSSMLTLMRESKKTKHESKPKTNIPIQPLNWERINGEVDSFTWFGHSTFLLSIDGKKILIDPMFGPSASPVTMVGSKRFSKDILGLIAEFPFIDAVLLTHDHYDHLDYPSILKLKDKVGHFIVPLGVGNHLVKWGIERRRITELNWWDEIQWEGITLASVPSQHFSGRGPLNRDSTLWTGWVLYGKNTRLYTSGDGGYGPHFKKIGEKYGPFDLTLMEGGQYASLWSPIHMVPEESIQAHLDVRGEKMMLTHWGAFTLAPHPWKEPVERALQEAEKKEIRLLTPAIGETVLIKDQVHTNSYWWNEIN
ncbi:MBL fold metallo-hydrolase [Robertmurraya sp. Marseille-Q9965]